MLMLGLWALHREGLIHKDIKLENVVLDESFATQTGPEMVCGLKIIDFDTVEIFRRDERNVYVPGTDQYIAPETYGGYSTMTSDVWSLGVIMYTFLTGHFPFNSAIFNDSEGENIVGHAKMEQIKRRIRLTVIDYSDKVWTDSPRAYDFVKRCMCNDPKRRLVSKDPDRYMWFAGTALSSLPEEVAANWHPTSDGGALKARSV